MKKLKFTTILVLTLYLNLFSQNDSPTILEKFSGIIQYKVKLPQRHNNINNKEGLEKQKIRNDLDKILSIGNDFMLELRFNNTNSFFTSNYNEKLFNSQNNYIYKIGGAIFKVKNNFYFSVKKKEIIEEVDKFGEKFLVIKKLLINNWEMKNETKNIGIYLCYKASRYVELIDKDGQPFSRYQEVWYTNEIPIPFGPKDFVGFPGLVLQVFDGKLEYFVTKVTLNPKEKIKIKDPSRGKKITEEKFKKITAKSVENTRSIFKN